jgi:SNF2 family DNA or RNA helicase
VFSELTVECVTLESVDEEVRRILQHLTGEAVDEMVRLQPELLTEMDNTDFQDKRYLEACTHLEVDPGTPTIDGLELILESYQVIGISWMRSMEEGPIGGGILGDFPDAGKSVQAIGLLVHSRNQWERDDRRNAPKLSLTVSVEIIENAEPHPPIRAK